jgi:hypothetical protein
LEKGFGMTDPLMAKGRSLISNKNSKGLSLSLCNEKTIPNNMNQFYRSFRIQSIKDLHRNFPANN